MPVIAGRTAPPDPTADNLAAALRRILPTTKCPRYLRDAAQPWLAKRVSIKTVKQPQP